MRPIVPSLYCIGADSLFEINTEGAVPGAASPKSRRPSGYFREKGATATPLALNSHIIDIKDRRWEIGKSIGSVPFSLVNQRKKVGRQGEFFSGRRPVIAC
jgi:hypothetical protein